MLNGKFSFIVVSLFSFLLISSCGDRASTNKSDSRKFCIPDSVFRSLTFDTLRLKQVKSELALSGKIACNEDKVSKIYPLVSGHVTDVRVSIGDYVEKGKVLAVIESSEMATYYDEYKTSQSQLAIAHKNLEVTGNMRNSGIASEKDFLFSQNEYQKALAQFNKVREVLKINGSTFEANDSTGAGYVIKSPITGFVVVKNITQGMDLRPDANDYLFTISDLNDLWATASVYETDIPKIKVGADAEILTISYPERIFNGKVQRVSEILDPDTRLMSIKIGLSNPGFMLKPGMFAKIKIKFPEEKRMLAIKTSSIIFDENKCYLVCFRNKCDVTLRQVTIFKSLNDLSFIMCDSLKEGDAVIGRNGLFVYTALRNR
jgi:cobalt-zinc-cadmium efflux system membrane fusion protein